MSSELCFIGVALLLDWDLCVAVGVKIFLTIWKIQYWHHCGGLCVMVLIQTTRKNELLQMYIQERSEDWGVMMKFKVQVVLLWQAFFDYNKKEYNLIN